MSAIPIKAFRYDLPEGLIAQRPIDPPDAAKLLISQSLDTALIDSEFLALPSFLDSNDILVFNNTKVIPARIFGTIDNGKEVEILLADAREDNIWLCLAKPLRRLKPGTEIYFAESLQAKVLRREQERFLLIQFQEGQEVLAELSKFGQMPIPPYIRAGRSDQRDIKDYQSIFAKVAGSNCSPNS